VLVLSAILMLAQQSPAGDGPRAPYWQQRLKYQIHARLDEPTGTLGGDEIITYRNNSPDTLVSFALHLYLNAFRPGSRWADADSVEKRRRFNDLRDPDFAFNRISGVTIMGQPVTPTWPFAPDSTIARFALPRPLPPGASMEVTLNWSARPSTLPRRQGRRGRHFDFAQWYPRVVAYDKHGWQEHPLYPAGEFYGDFGEFEVTLDLPEDQVVGATGVPVCGDPGWLAGGRADGRMGSGAEVYYRRDFYGSASKPCGEGSAPVPGYKRIVWEAHDVHHFAMSMSPDYRYEGGRYKDIAIHVLYQPGDDTTWGRGVAVERTRLALAWLDELFGPYPWPQLTNVHRIEGGGTEFPMMVHDGSAGLGLIVHEVGHNYLMGILANNEWREGFLDEGFTSYQTTRFEAAQGQRGGYAQIERDILLSDLDGRSEPTSLPSERYRDFSTYNRMIYDRGELFYHQLGRIVGDSVMRRILRTYYDRWKLAHVDEAAFREVAEEVSGRDLSTFFGQWLHSVTLYDYAVGRIQRGARSEERGGWTSRVEVLRKSPGMFPVQVLVRSNGDSAVVTTDGIAEREWVTVNTRGRPREVVVNPSADAHDWNALNDRKTRGLLGWRTAPKIEWYLDPQFSRRISRSARTVGLVPTVWYNDAGGVTLGARARSDYLGRFERNTIQLSAGTRNPSGGGSSFPEDIGFHTVVRNPIHAYAPRTEQTLEAFRIEGRTGLAASVERDRTAHTAFGPKTFAGASLRWMSTHDTQYLDPARWDGGGFVEGSAGLRSSERRGLWDVAGRLSLGGGVEYRNKGTGLSTDTRYDVQPYLRLTAEAAGRRPVGTAAVVGVRVFGGWTESGRRLLQQRRLFLFGADPLAEFGHPFMQSRGSLLAGRSVHYHLPGGGGVRGVSAGLTASLIGAINVELERRLVTRLSSKLFRDVRIAGFADGAVANGDIRLDDGGAFVGDAGVGIRSAHRIGDTAFETRIDLPLLVSRPELALHERGGHVRLRYVVSFQPAF
jgi:hypothetical protein